MSWKRGLFIRSGVAGLFMVALCCVPLSVLAQGESVASYQKPPQEIIDLVDAPLTPSLRLSPQGDQLLLMERPALRTIRDLAEPELRLAGIRFNPENHGPSRPNYYLDLSLKSIDEGVSRSVSGLPDRPRIRDVRFSPDGRQVAFTQVAPDRVSLWLVDVESAEAREVSELDVHASYPGTPYEWGPDSEYLLVRRVAPDQDTALETDGVPEGPIVQENRGRAAPARTYQDLLEDSHDERLFEHYFQVELVRLSLEGEQTILADGIISSFSPSPDGRYLLVETLQQPWSYSVPFFRFARTIEVLDHDGEAVHEVVDRDLADDLPIAFDATVTGPRSVSWRSDADATLFWAEAQDGGDPREEVEVRERLYLLDAPFDGEPVALAELGDRFRGVTFGDGGTALVLERWYNNRAETMWQVAPDQPETEPRKLWERSWEDRYNDPGEPMTRRGETGHRVLVLDDGALFMSGDGASEEGDRPFLDRFELDSKDSERLWRSESPWYESVVAMLDAETPVVLTRREQVDTPPNYYWRDLATDSLGQITDFEHPLPELKGVSRELITYEREDGLPLSAQMYLPADYDPEEDGPLPTLVWAYPREYRSADAAGQIQGSPYEFNRLSYWGPHFALTQGYAVLDRATMPVVGEGDQEPNDTFIEQLVMNGEAAVQAGVEQGVTDPDRVAIGGHSYGAFMTANVLAHSDTFQAGIARSGAFNRTLTPFGFQREQRTIWDDTDLYIGMSPFFAADTLDNPILLIHGAEDNNSGTYPMQSERFFEALRGLGGTARLVMLPEESHGYRARESVLHMLHEQLEWMEEFVRQADN
ncbi:dipeptidyl aminopeptidase/acylaminoacyl peptidase [Natronospira proteinivora]|uniref:Dipeptidyl aminopeptidase/acylaminoacyl peptidase n=1 Tax=Natronospira proteinivora TaxID=1807133 RepID=A0ABT1GA12_9GAMM|nr:prolyl oligopeptidase family serine peptidase [Natronospira proteinivora]MCP1727750.1 dipeptidyl aminopeptidase/acylaminoacyl peptidase [Natronospira proteinivora]